MKTAIIIGAGPAGLTAAYELIKKTDIKPIILESTNSIGGLAKNIYWNGNIIDPGGHRFFSKNEEINKIWQEFMPLQGKPSNEEIKVGYSTKLSEGGADPELNDDVLLMRTRLSRILYLNKFFDYPLSINFKTIKRLGFKRTTKAGCSYLLSKIKKKKETNLENFYINRFGKYLYSIFFESYTEKLWGRHPSKIDASWGKQRVKGLSLFKAVINSITKPFRKDNQKVEASLVGSFSYPKLGPGSLYEKMAKYCQSKGGILKLNSKVSKININKMCFESVELDNGELIKGDYLISSMPIKDLIKCFPNRIVSPKIKQIANGLPYRDFITVNLLLEDLEIHNNTKKKTIRNRIPDTWLYVQENKVKMGRIQILNNWSPYLSKDNNKTFIGLEFFANKNDDLWLKDEALINLAIKEGEKLGILKKEKIIDATINRLEKAYPAYFDTYNEFSSIKEFINNIKNIYCVGRNGQHRYNNMDHSMLTSIKTVECILGNCKKDDIWSINTKQEYHESKS